MAFYGYKGDGGECYWTPYNNSSYDYDYDYDSDVVTPQASVTYSSSYEFDEPNKLIEHSPHSYFDSSASQQIPNYYMYNYSQPRVIQYKPPSYASASFYSRTNYNVSNSPIEFSEPIFEEYDPTPYGGGYDIAQTYGKPLPPSDKICYPRSTPQTNVQFPDGLSHGSVPSTYGDDDNHAVKPQKDKDSEPVGNQEEKSQGDTGDKGINEGGKTEGTDVQKPIEVKSSDVDEHSSSDNNVGFGTGESGGYGYDWNRPVPYTPYGSGLEAIDLCESIFGYWPCLDKINRQRNANCPVCSEGSQNEPWKSTADYLFGNPFVYGDQNNGGNAYHLYGNESYYQHQPQYP